MKGYPRFCAVYMTGWFKLKKTTASEKASGKGFREMILILVESMRVVYIRFRVLVDLERLYALALHATARDQRVVRQSK